MNARSVLLGVALALFLANPAFSQETFEKLSAAGYTYKDVTVTAVTDTHLQFTHSRGSASIKLKDLDPEMQKHFGFDTAKSAAAEKTQREANAKYQAEVLAKKNAAKPAAKKVDDSDDLVISDISAKSFRGSKPPKFEAESWQGSPPDTAGKFVLIDFWATWCGPCRASIPELNQFQARYKDKLVVIGLTKEPLEVVKKMKSPKIEYAVASDTQGRMSNAAGVRGIPHAMLLDPSGIVRFEGHPGYLSDAVLKKLFDKYSN